jgi:hypothetical protein
VDTKFWGAGNRSSGLPADGSKEYRYRYRGFRLLIQSKDRMFFVPERWSPDDGAATLLVQMNEMPVVPKRTQPAAQGDGTTDGRRVAVAPCADPGSAELLRLVDGTAVGCGQSPLTAKRSDLFGYAGYGYEPSPQPLRLGVKLLLICTAEGTITRFGLANPKLVGEREAVRQLQGAQPANRPPAASAVVTDKAWLERRPKRSSPT